MLAVFVFTALVSYTDRLILSVLVDQIRGDLGLSDSSVGFLQGPAFTVVYVFAAVACGRIADRRKRRPLLMGGVVLWCCTAITCGSHIVRSNCCSAECCSVSANLSCCRPRSP
ncbi:MAG: MFS transporter [Steroidobacteraceae bacterium]